MKADAEQFRKRIDALWGNHDALLSQIFRDGWKLEPPDPGWRTATSQASPTPQTFYHKKIGIWLPHVFFEDVPAPPCPTKGCMGKDCLVDVNSGLEWPTGLHRVFGVYDSWWLDTCKFTCRRCGARFHATNADSVAQLPLPARLTFDVFMGKKYACDAALAKLIEDTWEPMGTSPTRLMLHHFYSEKHYAAELMYYAVTLQRRDDDDALAPAPAPPTAQSVALTGLDGAAANAVRIAHGLVQRRRAADEARQRPQRTDLRELKSFGAEKVKDFARINVRCIDAAASRRPIFFYSAPRIVHKPSRAPSSRPTSPTRARRRGVGRSTPFAADANGSRRRIAQKTPSTLVAAA